MSQQELAAANLAAMQAAAQGSEVGGRAEGESRRERSDRGERGERPRRERSERSERETAGEGAAAETSAVTEGQEAVGAAPARDDGADGRSSRERRGRYGRDRRERGEATEDQAPAAETASEAAPSPTQTSLPLAEPPATQPIVGVTKPPVAASAPAKSALPKVAPYQLPIQDLIQVASNSGLQWVNSDALKIAQVQAAIEAEPKPIHVPRQRPPVVQIDQGPLILVETRRDLRNMELPFEASQAKD